MPKKISFTITNTNKKAIVTSLLNEPDATRYFFFFFFCKACGTGVDSKMKVF